MGSRQAYGGKRYHNYGDNDQFQQECYILDPIIDGDSQYYGAKGEEVPHPHISRHTAQQLRTYSYGTQQQARRRAPDTYDDAEYQQETYTSPRVSQRAYATIPQGYRVVPLWKRFCRACGWIFFGMCLMLFLVVAYGPMILGR